MITNFRYSKNNTRNYRCFSELFLSVIPNNFSMGRSLALSVSLCEERSCPTLWDQDQWQGRTLVAQSSVDLSWRLTINQTKATMHTHIWRQTDRHTSQKMGKRLRRIHEPWASRRDEHSITISAPYLWPILRASSMDTKFDPSLLRLYTVFGFVLKSFFIPRSTQGA